MDDRRPNDAAIIAFFIALELLLLTSTVFDLSLTNAVLIIIILLNDGEEVVLC